MGAAILRLAVAKVFRRGQELRANFNLKEKETVR
jgi:hypothetical protein